MSGQVPNHQPLPPALAAAISRDSGAVRPLLSPAWRTLLVGATAAATGAALILADGIRGDVLSSLTAVSVLLRLAIGAGLAIIALREGVPSEGVSDTSRKVAWALAIAGLFLLPVLHWKPAASSFDAGDSHCYWLVLVGAAPVVALLLFLLRRTYLIRTVFALATASLSAAYLADVTASLICANGNPAHAYAFHAGGVVTIALVGTLVGLLVRRRVASAI